MTRIVRCALVWIRFKSLKFKNLKKDKKDKYIENNYQVLGVGKGEELLVPCKMFAHPQVKIMMITLMIIIMIMLMIMIPQDKLKFRWTFNSSGPEAEFLSLPEAQVDLI